MFKGLVFAILTLVTAVPPWPQVLEAQGFAPLQPSYLEAWMHGGQRVLFERGADAGGSAQGQGEAAGAAAPTHCSCAVRRVQKGTHN